MATDLLEKAREFVGNLEGKYDKEPNEAPGRFLELLSVEFAAFASECVAEERERVANEIVRIFRTYDAETARVYIQQFIEVRPRGGTNGR